MRNALFIALAAIMMLALCVGCGQGPTTPDPVEVNPLKGFQVDTGEMVIDLDAQVAALVDKTVPELEVIILQRRDRSSNAFSTTLTPDEIRQEIAANIVEDAFWFPDDCTIEWGGEELPCDCWVYKHAGVYYVYPVDFIGYVGIYGIFDLYTDPEIEALADALYWLGYGLPPAPPPKEAPC